MTGTGEEPGQDPVSGAGQAHGPDSTAEPTAPRVTGEQAAPDADPTAPMAAQPPAAGADPTTPMPPQPGAPFWAQPPTGAGPGAPFWDQQPASGAEPPAPFWAQGQGSGAEPTTPFAAPPPEPQAQPPAPGMEPTTPFWAPPPSSGAAPVPPGTPGAYGPPKSEPLPAFPPPFASAAPAPDAPPPFPAPYGAPVSGQPQFGQPVSGSPGQPGQPPYGPPPGGQPAFGAPFPPQQPPRRSRNGLLAAVVVAILVVIAGGGGVGSYFLFKSDNNSTAARTDPTFPGFPGSDPSADPGGPASEPEATEDAQQGPEASAYPVEKIDDLHRVCDENVYYPESPKRAGKAPHPVVLLVDDGDGIRSKDGTYYFDEGLSDAVKNIWAADKPGKVQMVACLDRVKTGAKIRTCKYDDPKPLNVSLMKATWKLRVVEVATGKTLLEKNMTGDDKQCPYVVYVGPDKKIYAEVSDRAAIVALRPLVKK